jgi:carboxymethylenebutenolidase
MIGKLNAGISDFEAALKAKSKVYEIYAYVAMRHGFHNDTGGQRYNKEAAQLAWGRTVAFFKRHLA